jgi:hypothetical protein
MTLTIMQAVVGVGSLAGCLVLFYGPWQWVCIDVARQIVFEKRDAIFDIASAGRLSFSSREYTTIRSGLQASIRFAHDLTLPNFLVLGVVIWMRGGVDADGAQLERAVGQIHDPTTRAEVQQLVGDAYRALLLMMLGKSLWVLILFPVTIAALVFVAICRDWARAIVQFASRLIQVEAQGVPSETRPEAA